MGKKKLEPYTDVKELTWEETETGEQDSGFRIQDSGIEGVPASWGVLERLALHLQQVDPELRTSPVWHWALCDDHCTFVFKDGRKAVITF